MEIKTARDLRVALAEHDVPVSQFAREAGIRQRYLSHLLHGRSAIEPVLDRIGPALARLAAGEIVPQRPRRKTRAELLREEALAKGQPSISRV